jgi:hypothetical protein
MIATFRRWVRRLGTNVDRSTDDVLRVLASLDVARSGGAPRGPPLLVRSGRGWSRS